jgi:predicted  nucleic acid-binding Zn-ribbon protein
MAFEELQAEIASLLIRMNEQPEDLQEVEVLLREKLNEFRAMGLPLPQDLADLEALLDERLAGRGPE